MRAGQTYGSLHPLNEAADQPPPPGQGPIVMAAITVGVLLMALQLWLLTIALDLYLGFKGQYIWELAVISGAIFVGGVLMERQIDRRPRIRG